MHSFTTYIPLFFIAIAILLVAFGVFLYLYLEKLDELRNLTTNYQHILSSFNELDQQAKSILNTDIEFHQTLDKLQQQQTSLSMLDFFSKKITSTLDETELFNHIDASLCTALGFHSCYVATLDQRNTLQTKILININSLPIETAVRELLLQNNIANTLNQHQTISSINTSIEIKLLTQKYLNNDLFILTPLLLQQKLFGILFFFNPLTSSKIADVHEQMIRLLSNQLSQSLENIRLFKEAYQATQMLETKVNERTKELSQTLKTIEEISKKKTEFISAVSHELRTPLTSIKGYAAILMTGKIGVIPEPVKERLLKINTHSDNLVKLINDLLDISRIESGRVEMTTTLLPIKPMLDNVVDLLTPQLRDKNIRLEQKTPQDIPNAEIDRSQYERVFINLISNAIKFTPTNGCITIQVDLDHKKEEFVFSVADTGIGISKENLDKIFDEFFRADNEINLSVKGTGLGLALAKNIVEAHFGRMWITSTPNIGTTFYFTLPFKHQKPLQQKDTPEVKS